MTKASFLKKLRDIGACLPARDWVRDTPGTPKELYEKCRNRTWLEFLVERSGAGFDWYEYRKAYGGEWNEYYTRSAGRGVTQREALYNRFNLKVCNLIRKMVPWFELKSALEAW